MSLSLSLSSQSTHIKSESRLFVPPVANEILSHVLGVRFRHTWGDAYSGWLVTYVEQQIACGGALLDSFCVALVILESSYPPADTFSFILLGPSFVCSLWSTVTHSLTLSLFHCFSSFYI